MSMEAKLEADEDEFLIVGFYYNKSYDIMRFFRAPPCSPSQQQQQQQQPDYASYFLNNNFDTRAGLSRGWRALTVLNSSNGLLLLYTSTFLQGKDAVLLVYNPIYRNSVSHYIQLPMYQHCLSKLKQKSFLVYGFAFEPNVPVPYYTIVHVTDVIASPDGEGTTLMVRKLNSITLKWETKIHEEVEPLLNDVHNKNYALFGPSVYLNGNFHWLLQPSGVILYNVEKEFFDLSLVNIPGDLAHVDEFRLCNCIKKNAATASTARFLCNCRFLGESGDRLAYARVIGDSEFSVWILEDYQARLWSREYHIVLPVPGSLFGGRVLAFDKNANCVILRVKKEVLWYNLNTKEIKMVHKIVKNYDHDDNCDGIIVPYKLPRGNAPIIPRIFPASPPAVPINTQTEITQGEDGIQSSEPLDVLCYHYAVSDLAAQFKLITRTDRTTKIPIRTPVKVTARRNIDDYRRATKRYSELVHLEASLHSGCDTSELNHSFKQQYCL
ncbi:hypothetical protein ACH5RR_041275 [Cinchona calisaya]|uniref:F-box associated domain-containing protein n=1 Tax=Cinchona calisaya TaxID=153742 RepID=A0ABD2XYJ3_9GENT